jgi:hypothetical protein
MNGHRQTAPACRKSANKTHAPQQRASLFNHLMSAGEQRGWHIETERFGRF